MSMRLLLLISLCSKSESQATFKSDKKATFVKMARTFMKSKKVTLSKGHIDESSTIHEKVSGKTTALSSLRTAQTDKSETRQNEKRYYKIQKVLSVRRQIQ